MFDPEVDRTLWMVVMSGCSACAEGKPHVQRFAREHEDRVEVKYFDLTTLETEDSPLPIPGVNAMLPPESIPAYIVVYHDGTPPRTISSRGVLTVAELEKWVFAL